MPFSRAKSFDLSGLRRITSDGKFIPEVDGFRLLAILLVIFDHIHGQIALHVGTVWPSVLTIADGGRRGVEFFFVISGFILGLPFARRALVSSPSDSQRPFSYRAYLLRRVTRLEPPYVLSLVLRLGLIVVVFHEDLQQLAPHFRASLFYVHNLVFADMSRVSPPTWSLEVEVQFYLLAPFLAAVFGISSTMGRRGLLIAGTLGLSVLSQLYLKDIPRATLSLAQGSRAHAFLRGRTFVTPDDVKAIAPDVLRPFIVKPAHRQFAVVGTMFDVSYRHDTFSVFPLKGEVAVGQVTPTGGGGASQYLVPGEQFVMVRDKVVLNRGSDLKKLTSWQSGRLIFEGEPLSQAIAEVSLYTTRRINAPQAEVRDIRINGVYNVADPDAFVESVARLVGCDIERHGNDILLIKRSDSGTSINSAGGAYDTRATS